MLRMTVWAMLRMTVRAMLRMTVWRDDVQAEFQQPHEHPVHLHARVPVEAAVKGGMLLAVGGVGAGTGRHKERRDRVLPRDAVHRDLHEGCGAVEEQ